MSFKKLKISIMVFMFGMVSLESISQQVDSLITEAPKVNNKFSDYKEQLSTINIPISISLKDVETMINNKYIDNIYEDLSFDDNDSDDLQVKVTKRKKIIVGTMDNQVKVIIPLHVWASKQIRQEVLGTTFKKSAATEFEVTIIYYIDLDVKKDWELKSKTTGKFRWDNKPVISVGGLIDIPLAGQIEGPLKEQVDNIALEIDNVIKTAIDLKAIGIEAWSMAQKPIKLDEATNTWLYINPKSISITPLLLKYGKASFNLGIETYVNNTIGADEKTITASELPKLKIVEEIPDNFNIVLSAVAGYNKITEILKQQFLNRTFDYEDQKVKITAIDFIGGADKVIIKVGINADFKKGFLSRNVIGFLFLKGTPYYDIENQAIKIKNLEYNLDTKDVLVKSAKWLAENKIKTMMEENLIFPVGDQIETAKLMIEKELTEYSVNEYATISGELNDLKPEGIYLTENSIRVVVLADGKVNMKVSGFK